MRMRVLLVGGARKENGRDFSHAMATRYVPGAGSIEIPLRDTDEVKSSMEVYYMRTLMSRNYR